MRLRRYLLVLITTALLIISLIYLSFDRILLFSLSKFYNLDITYKSLAKDPSNGYSFENLKVFNKKMGLGFFSTRAFLKPLKKSSIFKSLNFDFKFKDVHFIKNGKEDAKSGYNTMEGLVSIPFEGRWRYRDITGVIEVFSNGITLKKFSANGQDIRLTLSGDIFYNNAVDVDISIYFSKGVLKDIPPELHSVIMTEEPGEWKSFSVKLKGNISSPSIQISSKLFRLNIGTMVVN